MRYIKALSLGILYGIGACLILAFFVFLSKKIYLVLVIGVGLATGWGCAKYLKNTDPFAKPIAILASLATTFIGFSMSYSVSESYDLPSFLKNIMWLEKGTIDFLHSFDILDLLFYTISVTFAVMLVAADDEKSPQKA